VRKRGEDQLAKEKENYNVDINHNFKAEISRDELSAQTGLRDEGYSSPGFPSGIIPQSRNNT